MKKESEQLFTQLFNNLDNSVFLCKINKDGFPGRFMEVNNYACKLLGYSREELLAMSPNDISPPEGPEIKTNAAIAHQFHSRKSHIFFECFDRTKDGQLVPMEYNCHIFRIKGKEVCFAIGRDLTEWKNSQRAFLEKERKYRRYIENSIDAIFVADSKGKYIDANKAACRMLGYTQHELLNLSIPDIIPEQTKDLMVDAFSHLMDTGELIIEGTLLRKDGTLLDVHLNCFKASENEYVAFCHEVTERKEAEKALRASEKKYRELFNSVKDFIFVSEIDENGLTGRFIEVNEVVCDKLGYSRTELLRMSPKEINPYNPLAEENRHLLDKYMATGEVTFETVLVSKSGCIIPVEISAHTIEYNNEAAILSIARDVTERKNTEKRLLESEQRYRQLVELLPDAVIVHDLVGKIIFANNASLNILKAQNKEEIIGRFALDFLHPAYKDLVMERLSFLKVTGAVPFEQERIINLLGEEIVVEISGIMINYYNQPAIMLVCRDISQRKKAEESLEETRRALFENEKLALIGQMSAGMAHEVRNPLAVVRGYVQLLKMKQYDKQKIEMFVDTIIEEIDRVNGLISDFLQLARPRETKLESQSVIKLIQELLEIISPQARLSNVKIKHTIEPNLPHCLIDKDQIKQVIINFCRNSIDAMPAGGTIFLHVKRVDNSNEICVEIKDTGCGISAEKLSKLGTPFFSTKDKGTGLGLSISYSIIRAHKGRIEVASKEGKGTKFKIFLNTQIISQDGEN